MERLGQEQFERMCIDNAAEGRCRKHTAVSRQVVLAILRAIPQTGNLSELGTPQVALVRLADASGINAADATPLAKIIGQSILEYLIGWWFNNKSYGTITLERLRRIDDEIARGHRSWVVDKRPNAVALGR